MGGGVCIERQSIVSFKERPTNRPRRFAQQTGFGECRWGAMLAGRENFFIAKNCDSESAQRT
jgi:hypothetical protein